MSKTSGGRLLRPWPSSQQYAAAILAATHEATSPLYRYRVQRDNRRLPVSFRGSFGLVFKTIDPNGDEFALKVFTLDSNLRNERYREISRFINEVNLKCAIPIEFLEDVLDIENLAYSLVRMPYLSFPPLHVAIAGMLEMGTYDPNRCAIQWIDAIQEMRKHKVSHGDLHHDNVLVSDSGFRFIDYDAFYVPSMPKSWENPESGHPAYQIQPSISNALPFDENRDLVPALVILTSLLGADSESWQSRSDEGLLLGQADISSPKGSPRLNSLAAKSPQLEHLAEALISAIDKPHFDLWDRAVELVLGAANRRTLTPSVPPGLWPEIKQRKDEARRKRMAANLTRENTVEEQRSSIGLSPPSGPPVDPPTADEPSDEFQVAAGLPTPVPTVSESPSAKKQPPALITHPHSPPPPSRNSELGPMNPWVFSLVGLVMLLVLLRVFDVW